MAVGVFDLLHAGHLHYLEQAKSLGDELIVVVAHDETVRKRKHEPITNHDLRHGYDEIEVLRVEGLSDDLDGTRKIIAKILGIWPSNEGGPYEED
jgi:cytidyltransferase-like protein